MTTIHLADPLADAGWDDLVEDVPFGVVLHHLGSVVASNAKAADLLDLDPADLKAGRRPVDWDLRDDAGAALPTVAELAGQTARAGAPRTIAFVITRRGQVVRGLWADLHPVTCRGKRMALLVLRPVEDEPARVLQDPTTGLPHRALLFDRIEQSLTRSRVHGTRTTLVLADLRGLAAVNADHGFDHGDELLGRIAARLRRELRDDHTVARYTGGTFAVVAEHPAGTGEWLADRVRDIVEVPTRVGRHLVRPGVRTGWATSGGGATVHEMVSRAETSLHV